METFRPEKTVFAVLCILTVFAAAVSGSVYTLSAQLFGTAVLILFFLSFSGKPLPAFKSVWPAIPYLAVLYISSFWTVNLNSTLDQAFFFTILVLFASMTAFSSGEGRAKTFLTVIVAVSAAVSMYGIYQYLFGFARTQAYLRAYGASEFGLSGGRFTDALYKLSYGRTFSTLFSPNALACYLAAAIPAGLSLLLHTRTWGKRAVYAAALVVMSAALVTTKSAGGLAAFGAGAFVFAAAVTITGRKARAGVSLWLAGGILLVAAVSSYVILTGRSGGFLGIGQSYMDRLGYFRGALNIFTGSPITGYGAGTFSLKFLEWIRPGGGETRYAHDVFLQTLDETGLAGLAGLLILFGVYFTRCVSLLRNKPGDPVPAALLAGGAAFIVHNLVDFTFYIHDTAVIFWLYFGLAASYRAGETGTTRRYTLPVSAVVVAVTLVFTFFYGKSALASMWQSQAVGSAEEAVSLKPYDDGYHAFLANLYEGMAYSKGPDYALKAEREYKQAIALNPLYPYHLRDLGILYLKLGKSAEARRCFQEASRLYPANREFARLLKNAVN